MAAAKNWQSELDFAIDVCKAAGDILKQIRAQNDVQVDTKTGFELVTNADLAVDRFIRDAIAAKFPNDTVLSEEAADPPVSPKQGGAGHVWILDPLDGTANYFNGHAHVAISLALSIDAHVVLGVVHAPFTGEMFSASIGAGARRNGQPIRRSTLADPRKALVATGFPHDRSSVDILLDRLKPLLRDFGDIRRLAAPALDICWVADGRLAGFYDRIHIWDVAAAGLIAREAGARVCAVSGDNGGEGTDYLVTVPGIEKALRRTLLLPEARG